MRRSLRTIQGGSRWSSASVPIVMIAVLASTAACVSTGKYDTMVSERDKLAEERKALANRVQELEKRVQGLEAQLVTQGEEMSQLRLAHTTEVSQMRQTYDALVSKLEGEVESGQIVIEQLRDGLKVKLSEEILFATGSAELGEKGREVLLTVSTELKKVPYQIDVGGHTDNVPIRGQLASLYPTNWELAGARAARVVRLLEEAGIASNRLLAASYGENEPVTSNDTPEGRARNRRIEIRLRPIVQEESRPPAPGQ
jgi:chemotaxis protein MotB